MATYLSRLLLLTVLFMLPSVSSAAALTQQQANSLIAVVQSSPGTPANAFISLITAFSNITTAQATSLITVVQTAPGVPANAFVDLLTSFTVDTPAAQSTVPTVVTEPTDTASNPVTQAAPAPIIEQMPRGPIKLNTVRGPQKMPTQMSGTVNLWYPGFVLEPRTDTKVFDAELDSISDPSFLTFSINGVSLGHPTGVPGSGEYVLMLDTTAYPNGWNTIDLVVDDERGQKDRASFGVKFEN